MIHFGIPLAYYYYMKTKYLNKPWNIRVDLNYRPRVSII
ncbi:glycosyltransferase family 2 protein, partial [Candidatus Bathyarchaeota archaeon]